MNRPGSPDNQYAGRAAILKSFRERPPRTARHVIGNLVVDVLSCKAAMASSTILLFAGPAGDGRAAVRTHGPILIGAFEDLLRHKDGQWRIASRQSSIVLEYASDVRPAGR